ncbi:hypothetical protein EWM64_g8043 [Hericium alpestre]|uniref:Uncharacterized protein n=1 Tax=Hericium alpestre TaxID=135208 RepID=A0A4Y9ZR63_9AGAM|nr:hypothetical protein EWM64_g8043 [Hericium alpestre]
MCFTPAANDNDNDSLVRMLHPSLDQSCAAHTTRVCASSAMSRPATIHAEWQADKEKKMVHAAARPGRVCCMHFVCVRCPSGLNHWCVIIQLNLICSILMALTDPAPPLH